MMYVKTAILGCEKIKGVCEMNVRFMDLRIKEKEAEVLMEAIRRVFNHGFLLTVKSWERLKNIFVGITIGHTPLEFALALVHCITLLGH